MPKFTVNYLSLDRTQTYWSNVWADNINEATGTAKRRARKNFRAVLISQVEGSD